MAGSYSDVVKCLWLGSPLFHHADLMERQSWRQRQIDKARESTPKFQIVVSLTSTRKFILAVLTEAQIKTQSCPAVVRLLTCLILIAMNSTDLTHLGNDIQLTSLSYSSIIRW